MDSFITLVPHWKGKVFPQVFILHLPKFRQQNLLCHTEGSWQVAETLAGETAHLVVERELHFQMGCQIQTTGVIVCPIVFLGCGMVQLYWDSVDIRQL